MVRLLNAFSLNMLTDNEGTIRYRQITLEQAKGFLVEHGFESFVGHTDTARVMSQLLGLEVAPNRGNAVLRKGDVAIVGQYRGPRLPEGATQLPEGASIAWYLVWLE